MDLQEIYNALEKLQDGINDLKTTDGLTEKDEKLEDIYQEMGNTLSSIEYLITD